VGYFLTMAKQKNTSANSESVKSVIARSDDGTIQITFTIPYLKIEKAKNETLEELAKEIEIPGFRKGKAPYEQIANRISQQSILEKTLGRILPDLLSDAITEYKLTPAVYPKFELVKAKEGEDWQIRAITCEIPEFDLGDYKQSLATLALGKKEIIGVGKAGVIWTPGKDKSEKKVGDLSRSQKEQKVIETLVASIKVPTPKILIDQETDARLSNLLSRLEKLGLTLESYLASIGKTAESIRKEYETQAVGSIGLELILNKIAEKEKVQVDEGEITKTLEAASADPKLREKLDTPEQKRLIKNILIRRHVLDSLISLM